MVAVTRKTTEVTNFEATPQKMNDQQHAGAKLHIHEGTFELAVADPNGAIYGLVWLHKSWSVKSIKIANDAVDSGTDFDLGLYSSPDDDQDSADLNAADTDGDHDAYGTAINLSSAAQFTEFGYEAKDVANVKRQVWQDAGAASFAAAKDWYLLALTANYDVAAIDTISFQVEFTLPGGA